MLFWTVLVVTIASIIAVIVMKVRGFDFDYHFGVLTIAWVAIALLAITTIIMSCVVIDARVNSDAYAAAMEQRYESLTYQLENGLYNNDNEYGKKDLYNQVQEWNEDLASCKKLQDNPWTGIFYYHVYDQFEFIKLPAR